MTDWPTGWVVMAGGTFTVNVAPLLVADPMELAATTE